MTYGIIDTLPEYSHIYSDPHEPMNEEVAMTMIYVDNLIYQYYKAPCYAQRNIVDRAADKLIDWLQQEEFKKLFLEYYNDMTNER